MLLSIGLPDEKQLMGAYSKVPNQRSTKSRDDRPQTGAQAPGSSATIKEAPTGRQRPKHVVIKHVTCSVALSGLSFVNALVPGVTPPSVVFRAFGAYSADSNNTYPFAVRRTFLPRPFRSFSSAFLSNRSRRWAYSKVLKGRETTDGGASPR